MLKPGARFVILEFATPRFAPLRALYHFYFRHILPAVGRMVSKHREANTYLPESVLAFPEPEALSQRLLAAGFSRVGFIPVVDTFAQFGVTKGALPLTMASLSDAPMICIFSHTGFQDAADGASHQALSYLAMLSAIPHVDTYCLTCSEEADSLITQAIEKFASDRKEWRSPQSSVFFLGRENFPKAYVSGATYDLKKAQVIRETGGSRPVTILASGSMVPQALQAADQLAATGVIVINPGLHNHLDTATVRAALKKSEGRLVVVEDHQQIGGLAQMAAFDLAREGVSFQLKSLAVHGEFGQSAYSAQELYSKHKLDATAIVEAAKELLNK